MKVTVSSYWHSHGLGIYLLPSLNIDLNFLMPVININWIKWDLTIFIYKRVPKWFAKIF